MSIQAPPDFDFLRGRWQVRHRRLVKRLAGCTDWEVFDGRSELWLVMGGAGTVDDNVIDLPSGSYRAATLRSWDPATQNWQIWWLDARMPTEIGTPMRGRFEDGTGTFYADESFEGRPIRVRFLWLHTRSARPRWEQAFSTDGGQSWETNWEMDFSRADAAA